MVATGGARSGEGDARTAVTYLVAPEADEYIALMGVLDASLTDMTLTEVCTALAETDLAMPEQVVQARLDKLHEWAAATPRTDTSTVRRYADLLARNWRWTASPAGRQVHRFYTAVLVNTPAMREIPLASLARVVSTLEELVGLEPSRDPARTVELVGRLFTAHDDLDAALVGAEDSLAGLADRFDLDDADTGELKTLLVNYATRVAVHLEDGSAKAWRTLSALTPRFTTLAEMTVAASDAHALIARGALAASRGGRTSDWEQLTDWCNPGDGRARRFSMRLIRALPAMHTNLRRLHATAGADAVRARALRLALAAADPALGGQVFQAALGDHAWRKLFAEADDAELGRIAPWRDGPQVMIPQMLRATGRSGPRGRAPAARDASAAAAEVAARRAERDRVHADALAEVLIGPTTHTPPAGRLALSALMAAARSTASVRHPDRRTGTAQGLSCTLFACPGATGRLAAPTWTVTTPGRVPVFHLPGHQAQDPATPTGRDTSVVELWTEGVVA